MHVKRQSPLNASKPAGGSTKNLTALLLGFIVLYQIMQHIYLQQALSQEDDELESDAACHAIVGASGRYACQEAQLFKGWHESPPELEKLLEKSPEQPAPTTSAAPQAPLVVLVESPKVEQAAHDVAKPEAVRPQAITETAQPAAELKSDALEGMLWDLVWQMGGGNKSHEAPDKKKKKPQTKANTFLAKQTKTKVKKSHASGLDDLQRKLESKMQVHARRHAEHRALRALSVAARGHSRESQATATAETMTPKAHDDDLPQDLSAAMHMWRKGRVEHDAVTRKPISKVVDVMTPWAHDIEELTHELQDHMDVRAKHAAEHAAHQKALTPVTRSPIMEEVDSLGRQLCQDPDRVDNPACAQFLHPSNRAPIGHTAKDRHDQAMAHIKLLEKHLEELEKDREHDNELIQNESTEFLRELCADPARHSYPTCAHLLAKPTAAPARHQPKKVTYPAVISWEATNGSRTDHMHHHAGDGPLLLGRHELHGRHWEGGIPKVACITVLPEGQVTEVLMRYFMDNYKLQRYEGMSELVFVYHEGDKEAARIANLYADGTSIKASGARSLGGYPSATAYRYGAWHAHDAELVVRWDFEAWHHPNRLSMQVRALALAKRPVSIVPMVTAFDAEGKNFTVAGGVGAHGSMMGEAAWMHQHWMPLLEEERAMPHGLHSQEVVQVAMPSLLVYHDASMLNGATSA